MSGQINASEFLKLWTQQAQRVYAYILALVPNRADADEILQDTSTVLWEKFDQFRPGTDFRAWACQIALNKIRNLRRKQARAYLLLDDSLLEIVSEQAIAESDIFAEQYKALADCFAKLRPGDQRIINLRYRANASVKDMATQIGRSADSLYKSLKRIHVTLLECVRGRVVERGQR